MDEDLETQSTAAENQRRREIAELRVQNDQANFEINLLKKQLEDRDRRDRGDDSKNTVPTVPNFSTDPSITHAIEEARRLREEVAAERTARDQVVRDKEMMSQQLESRNDAEQREVEELTQVVQQYVNNERQTCGALEAEIRKGKEAITTTVSYTHLTLPTKRIV